MNTIIFVDCTPSNLPSRMYLFRMLHQSPIKVTFKFAMNFDVISSLSIHLHMRLDILSLGHKVPNLRYP